MSLPTYDKTKRKQSFQMLPKGAYVVKILKADQVRNKSNSGTHLEIAFDIAEGEYKDFYTKMYKANTNEDKKYSMDAYYRLSVPDDTSKQYVFDNWNTFFADLEDSNNGFVFDTAKGNLNDLKGKLIGGKFHIEQSEYNGNIYDHTRLRWTCVADDVRTGNYGKMPADKLVENTGALATTPDNAFMPIPSEVDEDIPFL